VRHHAAGRLLALRRSRLAGSRGLHRCADACFRQAQQLVQRDDALSEGVHRLFTACKYKSAAACELLRQHARFPKLGDDFQMPLPDMNRFFRECQDLDLYAICKISAARVLEDCRAPRETLAEMPNLLGALNGQAATPVTWDGKPVPVSLRLTFKFPAPSNPNQPTHCTPGQTWH
jgi:hypothetical protein